MADVYSGSQGHKAWQEHYRATFLNGGRKILATAIPFKPISEKPKTKSKKLRFVVNDLVVDKDIPFQDRIDGVMKTVLVKFEKGQIYELTEDDKLKVKLEDGNIVEVDGMREAVQGLRYAQAIPYNAKTEQEFKAKGYRTEVYACQSCGGGKNRKLRFWQFEEV